MQRFRDKFENLKAYACVVDAERYHDMEISIRAILDIAMRQSSADQEILMIIEYIGKIFQAERCYIFEEYNGMLDNTYEWVGSGIIPQKENLQQIPKETADCWYSHFEKGEVVVCEDIEDVKESDPLLYAALKPQDITSVIVGPLWDEDKIIGFYGIDNPPIEHIECISEMIDTLSYFIISSIRRRNLEVISLHDQLTGFYNRYALYKYKNDYPVECSLGMVYCDVIGLKNENDNKGHEKGDKLLISVCQHIKRVFSEYKQFRLGGDEFLVVCNDISEKSLQERVQELKRQFEESNLRVSVGNCWHQSHSSYESVEKLIAEAEKDMYKEKHLYYVHSGIDRRNSGNAARLKDNKNMGYFRERVYYAQDSEQINNEHQQIIVDLLSSNGGVGIISGRFDENYTIDYISQFALNILDYRDYDECFKITDGELCKLISAVEDVEEVKERLTQISRDIWPLRVIGNHEKIEKVYIQNDIVKNRDNKNRWILSIRRAFQDC